MTGVWVLLGMWLPSALGVRFWVCWKRLDHPLREFVPHSQTLEILGSVPVAVADALLPFDLHTQGFSCLGVLGSKAQSGTQRGMQVWLDDSGSFVGAVGYHVAGTTVRCGPSFASYVWTAESVAGLGISSGDHAVLARFRRPAGQLVHCPGRSQLELLGLHRRQRAAQPDPHFVRLASIEDFNRVLDELGVRQRQWLIDTRVAVRRPNGQLRWSGRFLLWAALANVPPKNVRQWSARRRVDRTIRSWPPAAPSPIAEQ